MSEPYQLTAAEAAEQLQRKELSARELLDAFLNRITAVDQSIKGYQRVLNESALKLAKRIDDQRAKGETLHPWAGIPIALKDNMCLRGTPCTCSSRILENFVPPYDATVVEKLNRAGLIPIGKTNMDEFAMGSSTENSAFFRSCNPWDVERVPGGSSGGSAAVVGALEAPLALGSDTGGSIRQPAAFCSVVGMKPTYGRVSRYGLVAFASSLDQIGPLTRDVKDAAMLLEIIAGVDPNDSTSIHEEVPAYSKMLTGEVSGLKVGIPKEYFPEGLNPEIQEAVNQAAKYYESQGAVVEEVSLPHTNYAIATYYMICTAEASSNLARYDGVVYGNRVKGEDNIVDMYIKTRSRGFGAEVKRRIMLGTYVLSAGYYDAYYRRAQRVRTLIKRDFDTVFKNFDVVLCPTTPSPPFRAGEKTSDPLEMYLSDVFTAPANLAGLPGISLQGGFSREGLPIGIQLIGPVLSEERLLDFAYAFQCGTKHHLKWPELS